MEVLRFTLPVIFKESVTIQEDQLLHHAYLHHRPEVQLTCILEGEGTLIAGTSMHAFSAGDIFLIGANQPHVFKARPEYFLSGSTAQCRCLMICFDPHGALSAVFNLPEMQALLTFVVQHNNGFKIPSGYTKQVAQKMKEMQLLNGLDRLTSCFHLLKTLHQMNVSAVPLCVASVKEVSERNGLRIGVIYHYITKHYNRIITLDEIAAIANMSIPSFCRYFKQHTGSTFGMFVNEIRINEACKKMTAGNCEKISAVAYESGFNTVSNFNRIFKNIVGISPGYYLKKYNSNFN
ncbi:helix-turn-helix domain-containing protein [Pedobacter sp. AW31-3R]|uniref:helix-turn-helix domain-containing protein n=1 Tax=Pedobacter sp. AW31-3R TaxID=3445781 RepID=UPI003FA17BE9